MNYSQLLISFCTRVLVFGLLCLVLCLNVLASPVKDVVRRHPQQQRKLHNKPTIALIAKSPFDLVSETDSAPIIAEASHVSADPDASALILLDEGRTVVYPNSVSLTRYHEIIKLIDQSAVQYYSEFPLSHPTSTSKATVERVRIIKGDGTIQDVTDTPLHFSVNTQRDFIPLFSLSPGDLLDVSYSIEDYQPKELSHQFWCGWSFAQTNTASRLSRFVLITPPMLGYTIRSHGMIPSPVTEDSGGWSIREWRMTDIPPIPTEVLGINDIDSGSWLDVSTIKSWSTIAQWYSKLSAPLCAPDAIVQDKAAELTKTARTENEKIHAIQRFVSHDIKYQNIPFRVRGYVPTQGGIVISQGYGDSEDKAALMTALLAAVGIKSEMVLMSGRSQGLTADLPSLRFGHVISCIQTQKGPLFVDSSADNLDFGDLPSDDQQVPALLVAPTTTALTETPVLPTDGDSFEEFNVDTLAANGTLRGTFNGTLSGRQAWEMRLFLQQVPESKREEALQHIASYLVRGSTAEGESVQHLDEPDLPLQLNFTFHVDHYSTAAGSFLLMPLPWSGQAKDESVASLLAEPKRTQDLEAASSRGCSHDVARIHLPPGYLPQELPADVHQETPYGSSRTHYEVTGDLLTATRDVDFTALRVPASEVPAYAAFLKAINDEMARQIVLKKP